MLIKLTKDWTSYKAGDVVDVYSSKAKVLIGEGIGIDAEKPEPYVVLPALRADGPFPFRFQFEDGLD